MPNDSIQITRDDRKTVQEGGYKLTFKSLRGKRGLYKCNQLPRLGLIKQTDIERVRNQIFPRHRKTASTVIHKHLKRVLSYKFGIHLYADCPFCDVTSSPLNQTGRRICSRCLKAYIAE